MIGLAIVMSVGGCASNWKIQGGPRECISMCQKWNLEFAGMVGVGNQNSTGDGATACVCQVPTRAGAAKGDATKGEGGVAASMAAPISAAQAAAAAAAAQQQQALQGHQGGVSR